MADTSIGQVQVFYKLMGDYYQNTGNYYQNPVGEAPLFMELLPNINYQQVITESNNLRTNNPSMVSGALIESANSMFSILREASLRSKTRADFWAESELDTSQDSEFYSGQSQLMVSYIQGRNPNQT